MRLERSTAVRAAPEALWVAAMDVPNAARCMPGVAAVTPTATDRYRGSLLVQVGPVRLVLDGDITVVARDDSSRRARVTVEARDTRLGGTVRASVDVALDPDPAGARLGIEAEVEVAGPIATFGEPVIRRKAAQLLEQFADCLARTASSR